MTVETGNIEIPLSISPSREQGRWEPNLHSFAIDLITKHGNTSVASFANVLPRGLPDEVPIDADTPSIIHSAGREERRSRIYIVFEGGIWSSTETFQRVRSRSAPGEPYQVAVDGLVFLTVCLVEGVRVTRMLESNRIISDAKTGVGISKTHEGGGIERRADGGRDEVGGDRDFSRALALAVLYV